jgi:hypothetical protein
MRIADSQKRLSPKKYVVAGVGSGLTVTVLEVDAVFQLLLLEPFQVFVCPEAVATENN